MNFHGRMQGFECSTCTSTITYVAEYNSAGDGVRLSEKAPPNLVTQPCWFGYHPILKPPWAIELRDK